MTSIGVPAVATSVSGTKFLNFFTKFIEWTVNFFAFSRPSPIFTASKYELSPAACTSLHENGQYGWKGASFVSI